MIADVLHNKRILVVEDEYFIAMDLCRSLRERDVDVVGPAATVQDALAMIAAEPLHAALVDVNLAGEMAYSVADALTERSVPFVFTTGYDDSFLDQRYREALRVNKPADFSLISDALISALAEAGGQQSESNGHA